MEKTKAVGRRHVAPPSPVWRPCVREAADAEGLVHPWSSSCCGVTRSQLGLAHTAAVGGVRALPFPIPQCGRVGNANKTIPRTKTLCGTEWFSLSFPKEFQVRAGRTEFLLGPLFFPQYRDLTSQEDLTDSNVNLWPPQRAANGLARGLVTVTAA